MNKKGFIEKIKKELNIDENKANIINNILENNNILGKKSKERIINDFMGQLNIDEKKANEIYEKVMDIITTSIKEKIIHPFKKQI